VTIVDYGTRANEGGTEDPAVAQVITRWQEKSSAEANVKIGYLKNEIPQKSPAMQALITEAWLAAYPQADIALTNMGGMRDDLPAGDVTLGGITSVMPFDNVLVEVKLTGKQILQVLLANTTTAPAIGGMHKENGKWTLNKTDQPLDSNQTYSVLVNDFMYAGGDRYDLLAKFDPNAYNTAINWRQPVIDWIQAQNSSSDYPLDEMLAALVK
jgi:2',3'-cyclic-nucleotide 2'-phosphodiesterase (5'-nucleotidase family)